MIQSNELDNDIVTVSKLQVALQSSARSVQEELSQLTLAANTETNQGLKQLLETSALVLLRNSENWTHVLGSSQTLKNREEAEVRFNQLSMQERSKFSAETLTNVDGKIQQRPLVESELDDELPAYIVVTLLIGTADDQPLFGEINSAREMQVALEKVASIPLEYLLVFELLWSPQVETDALTAVELATEYADLVAIA